MESSLARCPSSKLERMRTTTGFLSKPAEFESTLSVSVRFHFIDKIINLISDFFNTPQNRVGSWFPRALNFGFKILFRNYDLIVVLYSSFFCLWAMKIIIFCWFQFFRMSGLIVDILPSSPCTYLMRPDSVQNLKKALYHLRSPSPRDYCKDTTLLYRTLAC